MIPCISEKDCRTCSEVCGPISQGQPPCVRYQDDTGGQPGRQSAMASPLSEDDDLLRRCRCYISSSDGELRVLAVHSDL